MKNNSIRSVVATGIGAALFVVIGMISIPTPVPNIRYRAAIDPIRYRTRNVAKQR